MRPKANQTLNLKLLILGLLVSVLLIFLLRSNFSSSNQDLSNPSSSHTAVAMDSSNGEKEKSTETRDCPLVCNKIPASLAQALIHYSTTTITPQHTLKEISVTARVLEKRSPCNFLVIGLGHDSLMWSSLNYGGRGRVLLDLIPPPPKNMEDF
ncbi:glucuronoxylan 4-O-methyltransferase 1-like [Neltuma alba]|uniref:glucuronoxylan 4-O-methyltransferase 1-like n=1 Tax=Neltuma alba TaxID=207710 RepID=UPI0010A573DF|nr:glucuronoxylan 4-O-methyltransferase 1-like [Prosopis alba]